MESDIRIEVAKYYDLNPEFPNDIPFYAARIPFPAAHVLELGCGTGRVLIPLSVACGYIHGVEISQAMISICEGKLREARIPGNKARAKLGDITDISLGRRFDLIIAPFRVFQNLETEQQVDGLFHCIRTHLVPGGTCILNAFRPKRDVEGMRAHWSRDEEIFRWEVPVEGGRVTCHDRHKRMDRDKLILYPELVYRRYEGNELKDKAVLKIVMRCYYPREFEDLAESHGFRILNRWGGYAGEAYGEGPELIIQLAAESAREGTSS